MLCVKSKWNEVIKLEYQTQGPRSQAYQAYRDRGENFQRNLQKPGPKACVGVVNEFGVWEIFQIEQSVGWEVNVIQATTTKGIGKSRTQDMAFE